MPPPAEIAQPVVVSDGRVTCPACSARIPVEAPPPPSITQPVAVEDGRVACPHCRASVPVRMPPPPRIEEPVTLFGDRLKCPACAASIPVAPPDGDAGSVRIEDGRVECPVCRARAVVEISHPTEAMDVRGGRVSCPTCATRIPVRVPVSAPDQVVPESGVAPPVVEEEVVVEEPAEFAPQDEEIIEDADLEEIPQQPVAAKDADAVAIAVEEGTEAGPGEGETPLSPPKEQDQPDEIVIADWEGGRKPKFVAGGRGASPEAEEVGGSEEVVIEDSEREVDAEATDEEVVVEGSESEADAEATEEEVVIEGSEREADAGARGEEVVIEDSEREVDAEATDEGVVVGGSENEADTEATEEEVVVEDSEREADAEAGADEGIVIEEGEATEEEAAPEREAEEGETEDRAFSVARPRSKAVTGGGLALLAIALALVAMGAAGVVPALRVRWVESAGVPAQDAQTQAKTGRERAGLRLMIAGIAASLAGVLGVAAAVGVLTRRMWGRALMPFVLALAIGALAASVVGQPPVVEHPLLFIPLAPPPVLWAVVWLLLIAGRSRAAEFA
jgi:DNA-directed RNA polymerase subunit RPC12/RpoP